MLIHEPLRSSCTTGRRKCAPSRSVSRQTTPNQPSSRAPKMARISDLIALKIEPEELERREEIVQTLTSEKSLVCPANAKPARKYEFDVFKFLLRKKDSLGIHSIFKF